MRKSVGEKVSGSYASRICPSEVQVIPDKVQGYGDLMLRCGVWLPGKEHGGAGFPAWGARCLSL